MTARRSPLARAVVPALGVVLLTAACGGVADRPGPAGDTGGPVRPPDAVGPLRVRSVADGDTLRVEQGGRSVRVRLLGIDAPELNLPEGPAACFGEEAARRARELLDGGRVWLEYDPSQGRTDRFGRELAYVWLDERTLVNQVLVREGAAHEYTYDGPYRYQDAFRQAQRDATGQGAGLWNSGTCAGRA
jgi:endonuclease YncB( thermonuclease family)